MNSKSVLFLVNHDVVVYNFRLELVEKLIKDGYVVHISSPYGNKIKKLIAMGCVYHELKIDRRGINIFNDVLLIFNYLFLISKLRPSIVLTFTIKPNIYGGIVCSFLNIPYVVNVTGLGSGINNSENKLFKRSLKFLYQFSFKKANRVFFQNSSNMDVFLKEKKFMKEYDLLPGSGVNLNTFNYLQYRDNEEFNIYYFGRLMKEKGTYELLQAAKILKEKYENLNFHLVGFVDDNNLIELVKKFEEDDIIRYHGYLEDTRPLLASATAVIQPSHHEGMSNVLLEASASGRPILASNIPGCKEIIEDGKNGFLFEAKKVSSIISSVEKFISLPYKDRLEMGVAGREKIENEFSRDIVIKKYMEVLDLLKVEEINNGFIRKTYR